MSLRITLLLDNPSSWFSPYADDLCRSLEEKGHRVRRIGNPSELPNGDIAYFLSCEGLVSKQLLSRNKHNIVIHASELPQGKGWSPLTWQILEGKCEIPLTLFEAEESVDSGVIYAADKVKLVGHELIDEIRSKVGSAIVQLAAYYAENHWHLSGQPQEGRETFYPRRTPQDSELDPTKSLEELFDQLRVADNERYPAYFRLRDHSYVLKVYKRD